MNERARKLLDDWVVVQTNANGLPPSDRTVELLTRQFMQTPAGRRLKYEDVRREVRKTFEY